MSELVLRMSHREQSQRCHVRSSQEVHVDFLPLLHFKNSRLVSLGCAELIRDEGRKSKDRRSDYLLPDPLPLLACRQDLDFESQISHEEELQRRFPTSRPCTWVTRNGDSDYALIYFDSQKPWNLEVRRERRA